MDAEQKQNDTNIRRSKRRTGILKWLFFIVCALVVLLFFALPSYISSQSFRNLIVRKINKSTGGKVEINKLAMGWFKGISLTNFSYVDKAGQFSISVKNVFTKPSYTSIILGKPVFGRTIIEQPAMIIKLAEPLPAEEKYSETNRGTKKAIKPSFLPLDHIELVINQGLMQISSDSIDSKEQSLQFSGIEATALLDRAGPGLIKIQGKCEADYDLAALSTIAAPILPEGLKLEGKKKESITFSTSSTAEQPDRLLENLNTEFSFSFDRAEYMGLEFGPMETKVEISNGLLTIAPFSTSVNNGRANFAATVDLKQSPMLLKTTGPIDVFKDIRISDRINPKLLIYLNPIFADIAEVSGIATFQCEKLAIPLDSKNKGDLEIAGTIAVKNIQTQASGFLGHIMTLAAIRQPDVNITIRPTHFVLEKGFLSYPNMQMDIGDNPVNFSGGVELDGNWDMTVTLPYTLQGKTINVGEEATAGRISLPIVGPFDKPRIDTSKLIEEQLKQLVPIGVQKLLEELIFK